jgi:hypothetical protein
VPRKSADLGAQKTTVILNANSAAAEQIGYCRDRFTTALGAGTDGEDKIAEGKFFGLAEDLRVLFHALHMYDSKDDANVHLRRYLLGTISARGTKARFASLHGDTCVVF